MPVAAPNLLVLPPKRSGDASVSRRIVYLDQNVVTLIAKAKLGRPIPIELADPIAQLREVLRVSVTETQTARCIESMFHRNESSGLVVLPDGSHRNEAQPLFQEIARFLTYYSFGLWLAPGSEHVVVQAAEAVAQELELDVLPPNARWRAVMSRDPQQRNEDSNTIRVGRSLMVIGVEWKPRSLPVRPWAAQMTVERERGDFPTFEAALAQVEDLKRAWAVRQNLFYSWLQRLGASWRHLPRKPMDDFIASERLFSIPYWFAETRLLAHIASERVRAFQDSDLTDVRILSAAIPYCDLVVTDRYMAGVARTRRLDTAFGTTVLPATPEGILAAAEFLMS